MYAKIGIIIQTLILLIFVSCSSKNDNYVLKDVQVNLSFDKMIKIPSYLSSKLKKKNEYGLRFIVYEDSSDCMFCTISHIGNWNSIMYKANQIADVDFYFIYDAASKDSAEIVATIKNSHIINDIYLDFNHELQKNNLFLRNSMFHYFLINENNQILLTGNPITSLECEKKLLNVLHDYKNIQVE